MATQSTLPALQVQQQQQPDLLQKYSQLMALKNSQQQQQMMQQEAPLRMQALQTQAQGGQIQLQQQQQQLKDQQAITSAMQQWDGKDITALEPLVLKNGGSGQAVIGLKQKQLELHQKYSEIAAQDATTGAKNIETLTKKGDQIAGSLSPLTDPAQVPDAQLVPTLHATVQDLVQKGLLDPQHAQAAEQLAQSNDPNAIRQGVNLFSKGYLAQSVIATNAQKDAQAKRDLAAPVQAAANAAETARHDAELEKQGKQRIGIEGARLKFQESQAGISPNGTPNPLAQAIAAGHIVPDRMGYLLSKNPGLIQGVMAVDPSFDVSKAQSYPTTYKDFTSGKTSIALNSGGTALTHLQELSAMNTDASHIPGTPAYNAYQNKADTVASELAKFYGDATIPAIASIKKTLTATLPGNRQAAIETQAKSMGDKLDAYQQTWDNAAPSKVYQAPMPGISRKAMAARSALDSTYKAPGAAQAVPAPQTHAFSLGAWQKANPQGDPNAAAAAAQQAGYTVTQ